MTPPAWAGRLRAWAWLCLPIAIFIVLRLPLLVHAPGGQDEQWFAVPGWTVWNEGIPRIPYVKTSNRQTFFENADRCLMALPPGLFYVQAPFHALFSPGYATSRIPLFLAALAAIGLTFAVARRLGGSVASATLAATLMAIGRPLMFTGLMVRPDLLSAVCGWVSLWLLWTALERSSFRRLVASGLVCGCAGLFHPFALVFAIQAVAAIALAPSPLRQRALWLLSFVFSCAAALVCWLPLILMYTDEFRSQFFANVIDRAGPGLFARMIWPWPSLRHHSHLLYEFAGPWQCVLLVTALAAGSVAIWRGFPRRRAMGLLGLTGSSIVLTAVVAGEHPTKGYWVYPCLWILAGGAVAIDRWILEATWTTRVRQVAFASIAAITIVLSLPGAGLRSVWIYTTHWGDSRYHGRAFIREVLEDVPDEGVVMADLSYVYDVYLSGRETLLCQERQQYYGEEIPEYQAMLLSWEGDDAGWAAQFDAQLVRRYGSRDQPQTCFVDRYDPGN